MNINYKSMQEASPYEAPTVKTLDILSEGVLCGSYTWTQGGGGVYGEDDMNDNGDY